MWYHYKADIFTFVIRPHPTKKNRWLLVINDRTLGTYKSPAEAAEIVSLQWTGYDAWDFKVNVSVPKDLKHWIQGRP
jgi:hypothetical protein